MEQNKLKEKLTEKERRTLLWEWLEKVDTTSIMKAMVFNDYGVSITIDENGKFWTHDRNSYSQDRSDEVVTLSSYGRGNIDESAYLSGWGKEKIDKETEERYFLTDDGRKMTIDEAIEECIEEGDFEDFNDEIIDSAIDQMKQNEDLFEYEDNVSEHDELCRRAAKKD